MGAAATRRGRDPVRALPGDDAMPSYEYCEALRIERSARGVLTATLNRPERKKCWSIR